MKSQFHHTLSLLGLSALATTALTGPATGQMKKNQSPNIIYILADDLGYGDLGCYGQKKIETPNIDRLATEGILFTQHYAGAPVCAPSRCVLLTGKHTGHASIRGNDEWGERGKVWDYRAMLADSTLEGQGPMPENEITVASLLQKAGYATALIGKWGLGAPHTRSIPNLMGFDFFYGYNCQRQAHTYYPLHLYKNRSRVYLRNDTVAPNTLLSAGEDPLRSESYSRYVLKEYAPDLMFKELTRFVRENCHKPFFLYWATPIPHVPLQAPRRWVDHYVEKFGDEMPYDGKKSYFPHRYPHAAYAAMVSYLDEQVGALCQQLKQSGIYENTLIIFTSDNGPTFNGGTDSPWFDSAHPFKSEQGWGKASVHEGGIRVPMIAVWPGKIKPRTTSGHISGFQDVLPTLCDIAGIAVPERLDGISFLPALTGKKQREHPYLYWEFPESGGHQAVRMGKWKGVRKNIQKGNLTLELYDLEKDVREQNNVAQNHRDIVRQMEEILVWEHRQPENPRFRMKALGE